MAKISKVTAQKRPGRYNIFVDGRYAFSASEQTVAKFVLLKGKELTAATIAQIKDFDAAARASDLAAHYLSYQPRTVYEITHYLLQHGITETAAAHAVHELSSLGYLDDRQYCRLFFKNDLRVGSDGPRKLRLKLTQKGVGPDVIAAQIDAVEEEQWLTIGKRVIKSMRRQLGRISEREVRRKMKSKLLAHGFDSSLAAEIIAQSDLAPNASQEEEALKKQGIKAYKRFRHLPEKERAQKIRHFLYNHGFSSGEITAFLAGQVVDLTDLAEY